MLDIKYGDMSVLKEDLKRIECVDTLNDVLNVLRNSLEDSLYYSEVDEHKTETIYSYAGEKFNSQTVRFVFDCSFVLDDDNNVIVDVKYVEMLDFE